MINSELLKEAIADAKAVRATALANAKAALEEAFRPRFEAMFAEKLKEESEEEDEASMDEVSAPNQISGAGGEAKGPKNKDVSKGQPKKEKSGGKDFAPIKVGKGPSDVANPSKKVNETTEDDEEKKMDEQYEEEEGKMTDEAGLTSEDLSEVIKELEAEVAGEEEGEPTAEMPPVEAPVEAPGDTEVEPGAESDVQAEPDSEVDVQAEPDSEANVEAEPGSEVDVQAEPGADVSVEDEPPVRDEDENVNLDELLAALNEEAEEGSDKWIQKAIKHPGRCTPMSKPGCTGHAKALAQRFKKGDIHADNLAKEGYEEEDETMAEAVEDGVPKNVGGQDKTGGTNTYPKGPDASKKQITGKNHNIQGKGNIGTGATGGKPMAENAQLKSELTECVNTIEFLRGQINEVNLLNAKLLYTNKLFKEFAQVLDDPYRMKIVEAFDLTKNVREVKLAYALLAESLNFGTQISKVSKGVKSPRSGVKQITESLAGAARVVASTKPSANLITEGSNEMADRFKKLAGIKSPVATRK